MVAGAEMRREEIRALPQEQQQEFRHKVEAAKAAAEKSLEHSEAVTEQIASAQKVLEAAPVAEASASEQATSQESMVQLQEQVSHELNNESTVVDWNEVMEHANQLEEMNREMLEKLNHFIE